MTRHPARVRAALGALAIAGALAACGHPSSSSSAPVASSRDDRASLFLSTWKPPSGQHCRAWDLPPSLPSVAQLVDTDAVSAVLGGAIPAGGYALFSLRFDTTGEATRAVVIETSLADSARDRVALGVANALRTQPASPVRWGLRLRLDGGATPSFRVGRSESCEAAPMRTTTPSEAVYLGRSRTATPPESIQIEQEPARWIVFVSAEGRVTSVKLITATHYPALVEPTVQSIARTRFHPALDDRIPIAVMDTIDFAISSVAR